MPTTSLNEGTTRTTDPTTGFHQGAVYRRSAREAETVGQATPR
jgi:hypothetical protein